MDYVKYIRDLVGTKCINLTGVNVLLINEKNEILLQRRGTYPIKWGLIGGIVNLGESLEDAAVRETKEETNLEIDDLKLLGTISGEGCYIKFPHGDDAYFINIGYVSKKFHGEMLIDGVETKELKFYAYSKIPDDIPKTHRKFIDMYYKMEEE